MKKKASEGIGLSMEGINFSIGKKQILSNITLEIPIGSVTGLLGLNGAGKTTLLSLVTGIQKPNSGKISVLPENFSMQSKAYRKRIGVVMQETALYNELTLYENLAFSASLYNLQHVQERIDTVLRILSLTDRATNRVNTLSGGLQRRVTIARALLHEPDFLIIDEPTLGVDADTRHIIWSHLKHLAKEGITILIATNYLDEALAICNSVAVLKEGSLLISNISPEKLLADAGSCIDISCAVSDELLSILSTIAEITHTETTLDGISVFLKGSAIPETIMPRIMEVTSVKSFRVRAADLAEIFVSLSREVA